MPVKCAVEGCTNMRALHWCRSEEQFMLWKQTINYTGKVSKQYFRICSKHFSENQTQRDFQYELLGLPVRHILLPNALPDKYLHIAEDNNLLTTTPEFILPDSGVRITKFIYEHVCFTFEIFFSPECFHNAPWNLEYNKQFENILCLLITLVIRLGFNELHFLLKFWSD